MSLFTRPAAWFALYAVLVTSISATYYLANTFRADGRTVTLATIFIWQFTIYSAWALSTPVIAYAGRRWRLREGRFANNWTAPFPAYFAAFVVLVTVHCLLYAVLTWSLLPAGSDGRAPFQAEAAKRIFERLPVNILIFWALAGICYALEYERVLRERDRVSRAREAELVRAQLHTLRAQLQPHFLFNALQSITSLISRDPPVARRMTIELGQLLRSTLDRDADQHVTLREELQLLHNYLAIEELRYGDRLTIAQDVPDDCLDCLVPNLLLQPLVENAIRHGIEPSPGMARLEIGARRNNDHLQLWVDDNGQGLPPNWSLDASRGHGLRMTNRRLELLYQHRAQLAIGSGTSGSGVRVVVHLPVLPTATTS